MTIERLKAKFDRLIANHVDRPPWPGQEPSTAKEREEIVASMTQHVAKGLETRDFKLVLSTFGRNRSAHVFSILESDLTDEEYWPLLAKVWTGIEWPGLVIRTLAKFLRGSRPRRELMTAAKGRDACDALPDPVSIFRGVPLYGRTGWSWTIDEGFADWFAQRHSDKSWYGSFVAVQSVQIKGKPYARLARFDRGTVIAGSVEKRNVIAYLDSAHRGEKEIVADPRTVTIIRRRRASPEAAARTGERMKREMDDRLAAIRNRQRQPITADRSKS